MAEKTYLQIGFPMFLEFAKTIGIFILLISMSRFALETVTCLVLGLFLMCMYIIVLSGSMYVLAFVHFINIVLLVVSCTTGFSCFTFLVFFMLGVYIIIGYSLTQRPNNDAYFVFYCLIMLFLIGGIIEFASISTLSWSAVIGGFSTASFLYGSMSRFRLKSSLTEEELKMFAAAKQAVADAKAAAALAKETVRQAKIKEQATKAEKKKENKKEKEAQKVEKSEEKKDEKKQEVKVSTSTKSTQTPVGGVGQTPSKARQNRPVTSTPKLFKNLK